MSRIGGTAAVLLLGGLLASCSSTPEAARDAAAAPLTDGEIAAVVVAANEIDATLGDLAARRGARAEVQAFGRSMGVDHRAINEAAGELLDRLGLAPVENALSQGLRSDAVRVRADLEARAGRDFDAAYLAHEVAYHTAVIDAVDHVLLPAATNAELEETLRAVRPALVAHLRHAEQLQASLAAVAP